jgi:hypothetical protein
LEKVGQGQIWGYPTWLLSSWKLHLKKQIIPFQELLHKVTTILMHGPLVYHSSSFSVLVGGIKQQSLTYHF